MFTFRHWPASHRNDYYSKIPAAAVAITTKQNTTLNLTKQKVHGQNFNFKMFITSKGVDRFLQKNEEKQFERVY